MDAQLCNCSGVSALRKRAFSNVLLITFVRIVQNKQEIPIRITASVATFGDVHHTVSRCKLVASPGTVISM